MRRKKEAVLPFEWNNNGLPKIVREHRAKYKEISRILDGNPEMLDLVHQDLKLLSEGHRGGRNGRNGDFTSETILRALVVHATGGDSLRETVIRIAHKRLSPGFPADPEEGRDGLFLSRQVFQGDPTGNLEADQRGLGPTGGGQRSGQPFDDPHRHDSRGDEYPLADRRVALVGHLPGDGSADAGRPGRFPCQLPIPISRPEDPATVLVHHPL